LILVTGENGVGKTNLLEALHVGTQGFSPRSRMDAQLVRAGAEQARIAITGDRAGVATSVEVTLAVHEGKRVSLNGARLQSAEALRGELTTLVFTPDRLSVIKGGPAVRRAYFDRALTRLLPARAQVPVDYGAALGQRNAMLRRVAAQVSTLDALDPWTRRITELAAELVAARAEAIGQLAPGFAAVAAELGLEQARLVYDATAPSDEDFASRLARDLERGTTSLGPHLDEISVLAGTRELRAYGSQGEQRIGVLALLLAEAELLADRRSVAPLVLLDDVLSELDAGRRRSLASRVARLPQALVTSTSAESLPLDPARRLEVTPGSVSEAAT
jgi:DNA replication and repair protein RecF